MTTIATIISADLIAAERADFHWDARVAERHLGAYESSDEDEAERDCVAILGRLQGRWFSAICLVDGNGAVQDIAQLRAADSESEAERRFLDLG